MKFKTSLAPYSLNLPKLEERLKIYRCKLGDTMASEKLYKALGIPPKTLYQSSHRNSLPSPLLAQDNQQKHSVNLHSI